MISMKQVSKLRDLHDKEKAAYEATHKDSSLKTYDKWVKACDKLNRFIETITNPS